MRTTKDNYKGQNKKIIVENGKNERLGIKKAGEVK
jgi:hypothetical protein